MRAALIVGINYYQIGSHLFGCVNDAYSVKLICFIKIDIQKNSKEFIE